MSQNHIGDPNGKVPGMNQERTEQRFTDQQMRDALQRLIEGKHSLHIPPQPDDEDFVIAAAIDEALKSRSYIAGLKATAQELFEGRTNDWAEIDRLNAVNAELTAKVQERDKRIDWLENEVRGYSQMATDYAGRGVKIEERDKEIERLRAALDEISDPRMRMSTLPELQNIARAALKGAE